MNSCDGCKVCCDLFSIPEIEKPEKTACSNCTDQGCGIYDDRPQTCKDFKCLYIQSGWMEGLRPDNCGVMFTQNSDGQFQGLIHSKDYAKELVGMHVNFVKDKYGVRFKMIDVT